MRASTLIFAESNIELPDPDCYAGLAFFAVAACLFFYPITRKMNRKIANELSERRKAFAPYTTS